MKGRGKLLLTCSVAAMIAAPALSADAPTPVVAGMPWWFHGQMEFGGRTFVNNPQKSGSAYLGQDSLAKYYEYSRIKPGPFGDFWMSTGSRDGLYQVDVGGKNVGYSDQNTIWTSRKPVSGISTASGTRPRTSTAPARRRSIAASAATI